MTIMNYERSYYAYKIYNISNKNIWRIIPHLIKFKEVNLKIGETLCTTQFKNSHTYFTICLLNKHWDRSYLLLIWIQNTGN